MSKKNLLAAISKEAQLSLTQAGAALDAVINHIQESLVQGTALAVPGFGTFTAKNRSERNGRNPSTGATILIPACTVPVFKPSSELKKKVNESTHNKDTN